MGGSPDGAKRNPGSVCDVGARVVPRDHPWIALRSIQATGGRDGPVARMERKRNPGSVSAFTKAAAYLAGSSLIGR